MQNEYGTTALIAACGEGHVMVAAVLIEKGALVNYQNKVSPLWLSCIVVGYYDIYTNRTQADFNFPLIIIILSYSLH